MVYVQTVPEDIPATSKDAITYSDLIRTILAERRMSVTALAAKLGHAPNSSGRKTLKSRLDRNAFTQAEIVQILKVLEVDQLRAILAVTVFQDVCTVFDPVNETVARFLKNFATALCEQTAASPRNFIELRECLCENLAQRAAKMVMKHQHMAWNAQEIEQSSYS